MNVINLKNIERDWRIVVLIFAVCLASIIFFMGQIYLSDQIGGGYLNPKADTSDVAIKTIDKKRLQTNILNLETKQAAFLKLESSKVKLVDPSL